MNLYSALQSSQYSVEKRSQSVMSCLKRKMEEQCPDWGLMHNSYRFTRRVTSIRWHPVHSNTVVAYGTHGGDILLMDLEKESNDWKIIHGIGMGYGCITEMRYHPHDRSKIYTTAIDGRFCLQDFNGSPPEVISATNSHESNIWWCSMDYSTAYGLIVIGDNHGTAVLFDLDTHQTIAKIKQLHKSKIKYMEFCPARDWMLVTASVDRTVKFWDIRMLKTHFRKSPAPLSVAAHSGLVSSAFFDPKLGVRLLTTAQNGEVRVYSPHDQWQNPTQVIRHPHRVFQHMTDIVASWHPIYDDVCVIGRYPAKDDPNQLRTVDLIDLESGVNMGTFYSPTTKGIISVNKFNGRGDYLASGMGYNGFIWKHLEDASGSYSGCEEALDVAKASLTMNTRRQDVRRGRSRKEKRKAVDEEMKTAKKLLTDVRVDQKTDKILKKKKNLK